MVFNQTFGSRCFLLFISLIFATTTSAQLRTKLQWMPDDNLWGIFVRADSTVSPSQDILLGSGQVTVVAPTGFDVSDVVSYMGSWDLNARVNKPIENPEKDYISFGISLSEKVSQLGVYEETLILTFSTSDECPPSLYLIEEDDPFVVVSPNSLNTNPGNDLQMVDIGRGAAIYRYMGNYGLESWNCNAGADALTTSLEEIKRREMIQVYPNPFVDQIIFEAKIEGRRPNLQIKITDNIGRLIHMQVMTSNKLEINIQAENALYFYEVYDLDEMELLESGKLFNKK